MQLLKNGVASKGFEISDAWWGRQRGKSHGSLVFLCPTESDENGKETLWGTIARLCVGQELRRLLGGFHESVSDGTIIAWSTGQTISCPDRYRIEKEYLAFKPDQDPTDRFLQVSKLLNDYDQASGAILLCAHQDVIDLAYRTVRNTIEAERAVRQPPFGPCEGFVTSFTQHSVPMAVAEIRLPQYFLGLRQKIEEDEKVHPSLAIPNFDQE